MWPILTRKDSILYIHYIQQHPSPSLIAKESEFSPCKPLKARLTKQSLRSLNPIPCYPFNNNGCNCKIICWQFHDDTFIFSLSWTIEFYHYESSRSTMVISSHVDQTWSRSVEVNLIALMLKVNGRWFWQRITQYWVALEWLVETLESVLIVSWGSLNPFD